MGGSSNNSTGCDQAIAIAHHPSPSPPSFNAALSAAALKRRVVEPRGAKVDFAAARRAEKGRFFPRNWPTRVAALTWNPTENINIVERVVWYMANVERPMEPSAAPAIRIAISLAHHSMIITRPPRARRRKSIIGCSSSASHRQPGQHLRYSDVVVVKVAVVEEEVVEAEAVAEAVII